MDEISQLAERMSKEVVSEARRLGYEATDERAVFFESDRRNLADDIAWWLAKHMTRVVATPM